ncbi:MAG: glucans biosynthesis glucosyltransferase MdoH [Pseudomonadota bacterium]|jgi:membrane glycosyltransferase
MSSTLDPTSGRAGLTLSLRSRRLSFLMLVVATSLALLALMTLTLFPEGPDAWGVLMLVCFVLTLPWTTIGFWHAVIGLGLMAFTRHPESRVSPHIDSIRGDEPITTSTAIAICIRNEEPDRIARNLSWMLEGLVESGQAGAFHLYILSDTFRDEVAQAEEALAESLRSRFGHAIAVTYRRREGGKGFKAGNLRDFCERWSADHDHVIVLDADSAMTPAAMLRLVRIMQVSPRLGILQTLVTGLPSPSAFARIFQFGMRLGMRSYTLGAASWQGDCGPYWGHNAIIRLEPFARACDLPVLPGRPPLGGHVLSHDQVEAVLMRRAGFEVRVMPIEGGSYEENPPTLLEFIRRDLRWCQGNMQYFKLLSLPGLLPVSRIQLYLAIAMYLSAPAWLGFMLFGLIRQGPFRPELGVWMLTISLLMSFAPKFATLFAVLMDRGLRRSFGGALRILAGALVELVFSLLLVPIAAVSVTVFVLGLPFGRQVGWTTQLRDSDGLPWRIAIKGLWLHTLVGAGFAAWLWAVAPGALWIGAPFYVGLMASIPLAVLTAHPAVGRAIGRLGVCSIPEEIEPPDRRAPGLFSPFSEAPAVPVVAVRGREVA